MYNTIWEEAIQKRWSSATIAPLLKEGIVLKDVKSNRLEILTNIHCKILKRMKKKVICFVPREREKNRQQSVWF